MQIGVHVKYPYQEPKGKKQVVIINAEFQIHQSRETAKFRIY